jgi:hypothetical protein
MVYWRLGPGRNKNQGRTTTLFIGILQMTAWANKNQ